MTIAQENEINQLNRRLGEADDDKIIGPFADALCQNLGLIVAYMPRSQWPAWVEAAYQDAARKYPVAAAIWLKRKGR